VRTRAKPFELLDLGGIVQNALADLEIAVAENGADIEVDGLPSIEGDASQIERLFQNLLANAIKFRRPEEPPRIAVRARILDEHESMPGPVCRIEVSDNGIGFDVKYLDRIFTPFQRLHGRSEYEGVGMGLAICRRIVERHRGLISAESVQGQGSTFIVTLPVKQPELPRAGRSEGR
jgi:two-component system, NtrC family, sensor kinase